LNGYFGVVSDPATFVDAAGVYQPIGHLQAILTGEQLFGRVTSLLLAHRDSVARRALLFGCLDGLEQLTGRSVLKSFELAQAEKVLAKLEDSMSPAAGEILLQRPREGVDALRAVQDGFYIARQAGRDRITWGGRDHRLDEAAAYLCYALRNATHGFGAKRSKQEERDAALVSQHDGVVPHDLGFIAFLYLLDFLLDPDRLRRILRSAAGSRA
jgi:hypothetical protein